LSLLFLSHSQLLPAEQQIDGQGGKANYDHYGSDPSPFGPLPKT
jgi:hypothetical protein